MENVSSSFTKYFNFLWGLSVKEIKIHYKNTFLGFLWIFLNPLLQMVIIGIVFSFILKPENIFNYFIFLFSGLLPWTFFSISVNQSTTSFTRERQIVKKLHQHKELIPLSTIIPNFLNLIVAISIFLSLILIVSPSNFHFFTLLLSVVWLFLISISLGFIFSVLNVFYRDVGFITKALLQVWFYATPIIYPFTIIPAKFLNLLSFNPLAGIINLFQYSLAGSKILPSGFLLTQGLITLILFSLGGYLIIKKTSIIVDFL